MTQNFAAIILAAGKGTRMKSALPKVLHEIAGRPMLGHALALAAEAGASDVLLVTAPDQDAVRDYADKQDMTLTHAIQEQQLGTGDAVRVAFAATDKHERFVVMFGDTPLMRAEVLAALANNDADVTVLGFEPDDGAAYGRVKLDGDTPTAIFEYKDADEATRAITLCNGGAMGLSRAALEKYLPQLSNDNAQGEFYLPDFVALAHQDGATTALVMADPEDTLGVDSRAGQAKAEALMQARMRHKFLDAGVGMQDPDSVFLSFDTAIAADVTLEPHVKINGGVSIGPGTIIKAFTHLEGVTIGENAQIGPYARLRPGTNVGDEAKIGNFVETKKADIGKGAKVSHLSYIGDAELGMNVNIGAGTITCNYDGYNKHLTKIGDGAFVGSNSSLIAPVTIGKGAYLGSSSAVSKDVPDDALVVTRAPEREIKDWGRKFRARNEKKDK
ncbi:bifunctional UDP-N-acetylglucosamine diphosphorylase/glucosamine-1-phosphate N-acetyltransferase GlmU [Alphaproteobacteria bacterium]|nr:bifunctional UDP-N-acetylglucosamine diphosphorylase/glucosamine-1-phosphate N-acetyltransferase GlmU [Alphaproteobacteria bacterium]MDA8625712.1 bifunctional UDP-N-acetylglucosamine diphosphorylase/glucosamine-1-phosphate N-acetyltransferase GlmU [Alphaproteobacteria bacterium]MDA8666957.1 bifunctional UDP-N-acetylglucosamine diphosphorylase/glucosamine-1-phosphate N-acetyltransferase GlmU [Alphaproteobacteria bacterium]MDA8725400.1 bifunctional UDP-N-acetylglucosamine diphosphorylase/glucos